MLRRLKLFLVTMLGFSTACSSVKDAPKEEKDQRKESDSTVVVGDPDAKEHSKIIVMYGVRRPMPDSLLQQPVQPLPEGESPEDDK